MAGRRSEGDVPTGPQCKAPRPPVPAGRKTCSPSVCPRNAETYNHVSVFSFSKLSSEVLSAHSSPLVNLVTIAILLTLKQVTDLAVRFYNFNLAFLETEWPPCMTLGGR